MKMHKEKYEELMLRFAKELHDVGVNESMRRVVSDQCDSRPNAVSVGTEDAVRKFTYRHDGYMIEATQTVKVSIKKCT